MTERLKAVNYEIYNHEEHDRFLELKNRSGIKSDSEFVRYVIKQLYDRFKKDDTILENMQKEFFHKRMEEE